MFPKHQKNGAANSKEKSDSAFLKRIKQRFLKKKNYGEVSKNY